MPRQPNRTPYTRTLSALRKTDLVSLSLEFRLSPDGSVTALRNRLKTYLNTHRDTLHRNPRYNALYPRFRRVNTNQPPLPPSPPHSPISGPSTVVLSYVSPSPARSDETWHGIDHLPQHQPPADGQVPLPAPVIQEQPPVSPTPVAQDLPAHYAPPPPPSVAPSVMDGHLFEAPILEPRKFSSLFLICSPLCPYCGYIYTYLLSPYCRAGLIRVTLCSPPYICCSRHYAVVIRSGRLYTFQTLCSLY